MTKKGRFIVFEGIDGSGKSTQAELLAKRLKESGAFIYQTREPSDSEAGRLIRRILKGEVKTPNQAIAALFVADRLDHLLNEENGLKKIVDSGTSVICDRYYFSSYAYHSVDMDMQWVIGANSVCAEILKPDCTIFIDVSPKAAMERIASGRESTELFETLERLTLVRDNYFKAFSHLKGEENIIIVNGERPAEEIADEIRQNTAHFFE